jgi:hypothetical protein
MHHAKDKEKEVDLINLIGYSLDDVMMVAGCECE